MTDTTKILQRAHAELWAFRDEMGEDWPTPDTLDALRFAVTEAGEALDAWMRANRPQYARNRERLDWDGAVLDELADCAMMLLTAMGRGWYQSFFPLRHFNWTVDDVVIAVADLLNEADEAIDFEYYCLYRVWGIATYPGMDLLPRLRSRYARIRAKQRPTLANGKHPAILPHVVRYESDLADEHNIEPGVTHYGTDTL